MILTRLEVVNYRNYKKAVFNFSPKLNIIMGSNAQGKTNLLESIYLLSTGSSPRTSRDQDLISFEQNKGYILADLQSKVGKKVIEMVLTRGEKKRIALNYTPLTRISQLMGGLSSVYFAPDQMKMVKSSPDNRRKFMDIDLCQMSKAYFHTLNRYNEILKNRNNLVKKGSRREISDTMPIWDASLAKEGAKIILQRKKFCEKINAYGKDIHKFLTGSDDLFEVSYQTLDFKNDSEIESNFLKSLNDNLQRDLKLGYTTTGPQRDDIKITLSRIDLRSFGSQGQQRTATLAMLLAEIEIFKEISGDYPILLLDDVLGELDLSRQEKLLEYTEKIQTILTTTHVSPAVDISKAKVFKIVKGRLI